MPNPLPVVAVIGGLAALAAASRSKSRAGPPSGAPPVGPLYAGPAMAPAAGPPGAGPARSLPGLDAGIDDNTAKAVLTALAVETDPAKLVALAHGIEAQYPKAAAALLTKAAALEAARQAAPVATPPTAVPPAAGPVAPAAVAPYASPVGTPPMVTAPAPTATVSFGPGNWTPATDADVARDGTATRYAALLSQPVGTVVNEDYGGRHWQLRVVSSQTDPGLTSFAKDVKGWIWTAAPAAAPAGRPIPAAAPGPSPIVLPVVTKATYAAVPPNETTRQIQHALNLLGVVSPPLVEDGINGPKTIAAVKAFQSAHGLTVDGIAGPLTQGAITTALATSPEPATSPPPQVVVSPTPVVTVRDVQHALNVLSMASPPLVEDGIAGPKTAAAVRTFQQGTGLVVDGIAGPKTKAALSAALAPGMAA